MNESTVSRIGFFAPGEKPANYHSRLLEYANIKLASRGLPTFGDPEDYPVLQLSSGLLASIREKNRLLIDYLCPADQYIQNWLNDYLAETGETGGHWLPNDTIVLDQHGLARTLSLPPDKDSFSSDIVSSYRVKQGICNNPRADRRTTKGVFHVCAGGQTVPADKKEVPKLTFARLLKRAINPPPELMLLPFTSTMEVQAHLWVSLLMRPLVCPEVEGFTPHKSMETRFFAPGNLVSNLDFVESIFGNGGDPYLIRNDARLDSEHWSGHTGCVILAPHLIRVTKKEVGLPHVSEATPRQQKDGMCWESPDELYNDGGAFKLTARDHRGVIVTMIADNYYGYCKKEVKTQLSYATNLFGLTEEEHAGGALTFPSFDLGENFMLSMYSREVNHSLDEVVEQFGSLMELQPEGYGIDKQFPDIYYVPADVQIDLPSQKLSWSRDGVEQEIRLRPNITYILPSGYKVCMSRPEQATRWRLVGTAAEGTFCHKPCTVSGGGKSEISKPITDAMLSGSVMVQDFKSDFDMVEELIHRDYGDRYKDPDEPGRDSRPLLSPERSFGSVVKLFTPSRDYTDEYNAWLAAIPRSVRDLVFVVKRFYKPHWGENWRQRFHVDNINGYSGHELKYRNQKLITSYVRVGFTEESDWRTFALRKDFIAAEKLQVEDDISVSVVVPLESVANIHPFVHPVSLKFVQNCEYRLFQRPDEAIIRGHDKKAELDFTRSDNFFSNYEPLTRDAARAMIDDTIRFHEFSDPIRRVIEEFAEAEAPEYFVSTSQPRIVDGVATKNPRYLQNRQDLEEPRQAYLAELGARLYRRIPLGCSVPSPVNAVVPGRRNNPLDREAGIRPLAVYNPVHYQELPELFVDLLASLTGKSPSTTGAGSEGALTKGPFNALPAIIDLNNALVSAILTQQPYYSTAAGYIGHKYRVDHDISLLIPEVWSRMFIYERDPAYLVREGCLEKIDDFEYEGRLVQASRLGYRINEKFVALFFGRVFSNPATVFTEEMLRPELQDLEAYVDGIENITSTQDRIARNYFEDNTVELACPPLKAMLHILVHGEYEGMTFHSPEFRDLFTLKSLLESDWYRARLDCKVKQELQLWRQHIANLEAILTKPLYAEDAQEMDIAGRLADARAHLAYLQTPDYRASLNKTLGTDPALFPA